MIFICGNGGSLTQADHFAAELIGDGIPCVSLSNPAVITSIANDYGYRYVFSRQIASLGKRGDKLIMLSTSGQSQNMKYACHAARICGIYTILITGIDADVKFNPNRIIRFPGNTQEIQEKTIVALHRLWKEIANDRT